MLFRGCAVSWSLDDCSKKCDQLRTVFTLGKAPSLADAADQEQSHGLALAPCYSYWSVLWLCLLCRGCFLGMIFSCIFWEHHSLKDLSSLHLRKEMVH